MSTERRFYLQFKKIRLSESGSLNRMRGIYSSDEIADIYSSDMAVHSDWIRTRCSCFFGKENRMFLFLWLISGGKAFRISR